MIKATSHPGQNMVPKEVELRTGIGQKENERLKQGETRIGTDKLCRFNGIIKRRPKERNTMAEGSRQLPPKKKTSHHQLQRMNLYSLLLEQLVQHSGYKHGP